MQRGERAGGHAWLDGGGRRQRVARRALDPRHARDAGAVRADRRPAKCQNLSLAGQLTAGVRYLDVRCRHLDDAFQIYHGPVFEQQAFADVLDTVTSFLADHPSETLVMSIKQESVAEGTTRSFEQTFASYVARAPARWSLGTSLPALGDARGKIVLVRRFDAEATLGIDASRWADNTTFSLAPDLRIQDAYQVTSNDAKWTAITALLDEARTPSATLFLDYTSGYQQHGLVPNIPSVADPINQQLDDYLADPANAGAHLGVVVTDFMTETRAQRILESNRL
ncbi:MAG: phosphatidylinositol-specific phospholipase C [Kofleriaceae bacterium]